MFTVPSYQGHLICRMFRENLELQNSTIILVSRFYNFIRKNAKAPEKENFTIGENDQAASHLNETTLLRVYSVSRSSLSLFFLVG